MPKIVAFLRDGTRVESEPLAEGDARQELCRIHEELDAGRTNKFVKIGANAIINLEDIGHLLIEET